MKTSDAAAVFTLYFFWQQFHYARQTEGISRRSSPPALYPHLDTAFYLLVSAVSICCALSDGPQSFFGYAIRNPFPFTLTRMATLGSIAAFFAAYSWIRPKPKRKFALIHAFVLGLAFVAQRDFTLGWFMLNLFHNTQYLKLALRFEGSFRVLILPALLTLLTFALFSTHYHPAMVAIMLALNFTHYTWDSIIWRSNFNPSLSRVPNQSSSGSFLISNPEQGAR